MEFCPKCGALIVQKKKNDGCPRCNYSIKGKVNLSVSEKMEDKKEIAVISEKDSETYPIINEKCKRCNNDKAYFWTVETRAGDESATKFFKCTKCNFTWRQYR